MQLTQAQEGRFIKLTEKQSDLWFPSNQPTAGHPTHGSLQEDWVHELHKVCIMDRTDQNAQPHEQESQLTSYSTILAACIYGVDGKCKDMLTPGRLQILHHKHNEAKSTGLHRFVSPPPQSFTSELVGMSVRKARATKQLDSKKIKNSFHRILPPHVIAAFKHCAAVTQEKMGLTKGLQSRPPTLLEQPSTWYYIWCLHWLFLLLFHWLLWLSSHLWQWCDALDLKVCHFTLPLTVPVTFPQLRLCSSPAGADPLAPMHIKHCTMNSTTCVA